MTKARVFNIKMQAEDVEKLMQDVDEQREFIEDNHINNLLTFSFEYILTNDDVNIKERTRLHIVRLNNGCCARLQYSAETSLTITDDEIAMYGDVHTAISIRLSNQHKFLLTII